MSELSPEERERIKQTVASFPPLTDEQCARIAALLRPYVTWPDEPDDAGLEG